MSSKLNVNRGTTFTITLNYQQNGIAATLVGATVYFTVKSAEYDSDLTDAGALLQKVKSTYVSTGDNAAGGVAVITLNPADTQAIEPSKNYYYDLKVKNAAGNIYKVDEGKLILDGSPTNRII